MSGQAKLLAQGASVLALMLGCGWGRASAEAQPAEPTAQTQLAPAVQQSTPAEVATPGPGTAASQVGEVVVTARLRSESVQNVPLSISVVGGRELQQKNIANIEDLQRVTNGLVIRRNPNNSPNVSIRGIGTGTGNVSFEQSAALFLDGAYLSRYPTFNAGFFDLDSVQVVKGTQASLLAKNTSLGALELTTRKPGREFGYDLIGSYETELGGYSVEGGVDLPVNDTLRFRVAAQAARQGGWLENTLTGDRSRLDTYSVRLVGVWQPTDKLEFTGLLQPFRVDQRGDTFEYLNDTLGTARRYAVALGYPQFESTPNLKTVGSDIYADKVSGVFGVGTLKYKLGSYTLTAESSYTEYDNDQPTESTYLPGLPLVQDPQHDGNSQFTQEVRIASPAGDRFNYVVGAFYQHEDYNYNRKVVASKPLGLTGSYAETFELATDSESLFGQANYLIAGGLSASLGLRGTNLDHGVDLSRTTLVPGPVTAAVYPPYPLTHLDKNEESLDGSAGLQYRFSPNAMIFGSYSKGTKNGGFLTSGTSPALDAYKPEVANTVELGGKFTIAPRSIINITAFDTTINHFQAAVFNGLNFSIPLRKINSTGVEFDFAYQLMPELRVTTGVTYANTRRVRTTTRTAGDNTAPMGAAKWIGNTGLQFTHQLSNDLLLNVDAGVEYRSSVFMTDAEQTLGDPHAPPTAFVPKSAAYAKLNLRIGVQNTAQGWELALLGRNLNDDQVLAYAIPAAFVSGAAVGAFDAPRTIAIQLTLRR